MKYIQMSLVMLVALLVFTVFTGIFMKIANYVGEKLGLGKNLICLWRKVNKSIK